MSASSLAKPVVALLGLLVAGAAPAPMSSKIVGDYVETRTASVFAGACHYNGEVVTTGREAIMAWNIQSGTWHNTDLSGLRAMASVTSSASLGDKLGTRKFELVIDPSATDAQIAAFTDLLKTHASAQLGQLIATRRAPVTFTHDSQNIYTASSPNFASMTVQPMPNNECCTQPELVWYSPLVSIEHRKVGYTRSAAYVAGTNGDPWQRGDENSAFYGALAF
jgi:hypothetical protein